MGQGFYADFYNFETDGNMKEKTDLHVLMLTSEWPTPDKPHIVPFIVRQANFLRKAGIQLDVFHFRGRKNPLNYLTAWIQVRKKIANGGYDLVHAQWGQSGILALPKKVPLVVTFRGDDLEGVIGPDGKRLPISPVLMNLSTFVAHTADEVILVSDSLARRINGIPYHMIPSGLDLDQFFPSSQWEARKKLGLSADCHYILFVSSLNNPRKRYPLAKQAVDLLPPQMNCELLVLSNVSHEMIPTYMNAADVLLLTSLHEGSPNVVKEALACNLPVVTTAVGDVKERLAGISGCVILENDSPETIARQLESVIKTRNRPDSRSKILGLDERTLTQKVIDVYRLAISTKKSRQMRMQ
jgi:teichuronic acid biosynthesis glycosyltransferase TuaC